MNLVMVDEGVYTNLPTPKSLNVFLPFSWFFSIYIYIENTKVYKIYSTRHECPRFICKNLCICIEVSMMPP